MQISDSFQQQYELSPDVYASFLSAYKDYNPLHIDADVARAKGFRDRVMHGAILAGFLSHFVGECLPLKDVIVLSYELHFKNPVYLGDKLRLQATIADYFESVRSYEIRYRFHNETGLEVSRGKISIALTANP